MKLSFGEGEEFIIMLLIENRAIITYSKKFENDKFLEYLNNYNLEAFNKRYKELLDKFMSQYAFDNAEKSE